jgi:hypothetical protein
MSLNINENPIIKTTTNKLEYSSNNEEPAKAPEKHCQPITIGNKLEAQLLNKSKCKKELQTKCNCENPKKAELSTKKCYSVINSCDIQHRDKEEYKNTEKTDLSNNIPQKKDAAKKFEVVKTQQNIFNQPSHISGSTTHKKGNKGSESRCKVDSGMNMEELRQVMMKGIVQDDDVEWNEVKVNKNDLLQQLISQETEIPNEQDQNESDFTDNKFMEVEEVEEVKKEEEKKPEPPKEVPKKKKKKNKGNAKGKQS